MNDAVSNVSLQVYAMYSEYVVHLLPITCDRDTCFRLAMLDEGFWTRRDSQTTTSRVPDIKVCQKSLHNNLKISFNFESLSKLDQKITEPPRPVPNSALVAEYHGAVLPVFLRKTWL